MGKMAFPLGDRGTSGNVARLVGVVGVDGVLLGYVEGMLSTLLLLKLKELLLFFLSLLDLLLPLLILECPLFWLLQFLLLL